MIVEHTSNKKHAFVCTCRDWRRKTLRHSWQHKQYLKVTFLEKWRLRKVCYKNTSQQIRIQQSLVCHCTCFRNFVTPIQVISSENVDALLSDVKSSCTNSRSRTGFRPHTSPLQSACSARGLSAHFLLHHVVCCTTPWQLEQKGSGFHGISLENAYGYGQDMVWWTLLGGENMATYQASYTKMQISILPLTKVDTAKRGFPASQYQGLILTSHYQGWVKSMSHSLLPFP